MFLYPLTVTLIILTLCGRFFENDHVVYLWVTIFTGAAAVVDFLNALPEEAAEFLHISQIGEKAASLLPFANLGFGWVCPAVLGLGVGLVCHWKKKR